jgi:aldose 1-epimerase
MKKIMFLVLSVAVITTAACSHQNEKAGNMIKKVAFGKLPDGREAYLYTLKNDSGMTVKLTNYGAAVQSIIVPNKEGKIGDVIFGYDSVEGYINGTQFYGATIGRFANRIAKGTFKLDGKVYHLPINDGPNTLHGGPKGFYKRLWTAEPMETKDGPAVKMTYVSRNGQEGFPGTLTTTVTFTLEKDNALKIHYTATTDTPTVINLTNHSYFNLSGDMNKQITDEELMINADYYTPVNSTQIPTGEIAPVAGTPMDFRKMTAIGSRINENNEQLKYGNGYDLNWVLNDYNGQIRKAAEVYDSTSGRVLDVYTDQPGIQFYSGNALNGSQIGIGGVAYNFRTALTLETQHYPDSPNEPKFPTTTLLPGQTYNTTTIYKFSVRK